jgi:hypothetical protein
VGSKIDGFMKIDQATLLLGAGKRRREVRLLDEAKANRHVPKILGDLFDLCPLRTCVEIKESS